MKINAEWHKSNNMPKNPIINQRLKWHVAHATNCACRKIPPKIQELLDKQKQIDNIGLNDI